MSSDFLMRAARHIALPQLGEAGQQRIEKASVLIVGVGGIGCPVATYLASSGVGRLVLNDFDTVDETNLGRQPLFTPDDVGDPKATVAAERLLALNPDSRYEVVGSRLQGTELRKAAEDVDVVFDCSDNFATRFAVNEACVATSTALVSGAAIRFEGQVSVFGPDYSQTPCYRCLYQEADESLEDCQGNGVLSPVPAVIGTLMAVEGLKLMAGIATRRGQLTLYDGISSRWQTVDFDKRSDCPVCQSAA